MCIWRKMYPPKLLHVLTNFTFPPFKLIIAFDRKGSCNFGSSLLSYIEVRNCGFCVLILCIYPLSNLTICSNENQTTKLDFFRQKACFINLCVYVMPTTSSLNILLFNFWCEFISIGICKYYLRCLPFMSCSLGNTH